MTAGLTEEAQGKRVFLFAHPAGHSLSPAMHNAAFAAVGVAATYGALDVPPAALADAVADLRQDGVLGANFSVPHKQEVAKLVDRLTPEAAALGAVNTVVNDGGQLVGSNTDGAGFVSGLLELAPEFRTGGFKALVLGAGGAARAVVWALAALGGDVVIANRDQARAARLVAGLVAAGLPSGKVRVGALDDVEPDLVVNSTSVGMEGGQAPADLPLLTRAQLERLAPHAVVSDIVYRPATTPLLAAAAALGLRHQNGVAMLVWQGALAFEAWTGLAAPVGIMRSAVEEALAADRYRG